MKMKDLAEPMPNIRKRIVILTNCAVLIFLIIMLAEYGVDTLDDAIFFILLPLASIVNIIYAINPMAEEIQKLEYQIKKRKLEKKLAELD